MTKSFKKIRAVILSGGQSSRFGSDKARARLTDGQTILESLVKLLSSLGLDPVVIVDHPGKYRDLDLPVGELCDVVAGKGPLGGLLTAYRGIESEAFLILNCDMPGVDAQAILNLLACDEVGMEVILYTDGEKIYPFPALYARQALSKCAEQIEKNLLSVTQLVESFVRVKKIPTKKESRFLFNMNTVQDWETFNNKKPEKEVLCPCQDPQNSFLFS